MLQQVELRSNDARHNRNTKLSAQIFTSKTTRACVPLMVARLSLPWDASSQKHQVYPGPIMQTMVKQVKIYSIERRDAYEDLRQARPTAVFPAPVPCSKHLMKPTTGPLEQWR